MSNIDVAMGDSEYALGAASNRFASTFLYKTNARFAKAGEMLGDPITGATFIRQKDGTCVSIDELTRFKGHYSEFLQYCSLMSLTSNNISRLKFDEINMPCFVPADGLTSIIPEEITLGDGSMTVDKFAISIDLDAIQSSTALRDSTTKLTKMSPYEPNVIMKYSVDGVSKNVTIPLSQFNNTVFKAESSLVVIKSIKLINTNPSNVSVKYILHSVLISGGVVSAETELLINTRNRPITPLEILMAYIFGADVPNIFDTTTIYTYGDIVYKMDGDKLKFYECTNTESKTYPLVQEFNKHWREIDPSSGSTGSGTVVIDPNVPTQGGIWIRPTNVRYLNLDALPTVNIE